jgi:hypothetical protein
MRRTAHHEILAIGVLAAALAWLPWPSSAVPASRTAETGTGTETASPPQIRSKAQLDAYLRAHAGQPTPLDALTPGARERFLDGLVFGSRGLAGFDTQDLAQLTREQGRQLLALFGAERYAATLRPWAEQARAARADAQIGDLERRYNRYNRTLKQQRPTGDAWDQLRGDLPEAFDRTAIGRLPNDALVLLYRAIERAYAQAPTSEGLELQLQALNALRHRDLADARQLDSAADALLLAHRYEDARRLLATGGSSDWPRWLRFEDRLDGPAPGPTLWVADASGTTLWRQRIDLRPAQILVTAGCHFSEDAARAIAADPVLGPAFQRHARWLALPPGAEDMAALRAWNQAHPQTPLYPIYDRDEWRILPEWDMPTFYLVRDGKVLAQLKGWPADDRDQRRRLAALLRGAGLLR